MKAIITVIGKDTVGIFMIMLVEIDKASVGFEELRTRLNKVGETTNTKIHIMHEDIFNSMHKI